MFLEELCWLFPTKFEYVAQLGVWVSEVVDAESVGHVVAVEPLPKIGELHRVLDEDGVMLWTSDKSFFFSQE